MKQITTKSGNILCVEVPEDVDLSTLSYSTSQDLHLLTTDGKDVDVYCENIPDIKILGKLSEITDKNCEEFVQCSFPFDGQYTKTYKNYSQKRGKDNTPWERSEKMWFISAKESIISLLQSEGIDTTNEDKLLIIKVL